MVGTVLAAPVAAVRTAVGRRDVDALVVVYVPTVATPGLASEGRAIDTLIVLAWPG